MVMRVLFVGITLMLSGCSTTVELEYATPPKSASFAMAKDLADKQFQYVELGSLYLRVAPADITTSKSNAHDPTKKPAATAGTNGSGSSQTGSTKAAVNHDAPLTSPGATRTSAKSKTQGKRGTAAGLPHAASTGAGSPTSPSANPSTTSTTPGTTTPGAPTPSNDQTDTVKAPTLDPALATTLIDGKTWSATAVPIQDGSNAFMVRGITGFWKKTSISVARYQNSDIASSITSKAENLVPQRLGEFAGVAAAMVSIVGKGIGVDSAGNAPAAALLPFSIKITDAPRAIGTLNDGWSYTFEYDSSDLPAGSVSLADFMSHVEGQTVGYWPVLACRTATLTVIPPNPTEVGHQYVFNVVVATPAAVRLQPVPIDGKLSPGTVCSASETGTTSSDSLQNLSDDMTALQQGIAKVKGAKTGTGGAAGAKQ